MIFKSKVRKLLVCRYITMICAISYLVFIIFAMNVSISSSMSSYLYFSGFYFFGLITLFLFSCLLFGICYFAFLLAKIDRKIGREVRKANEVINGYVSLLKQEQKPIKIFKINEYITLKLENDSTNIYVDEKEFKQCKYLLLNIDTFGIESYDEINSIDEIEDINIDDINLDQRLEGSSVYEKNIIKITPETEFFGHCSNLQAWVENEYDTRILHSNISFPLLKRLTEVGDIKAKRVFKEEIAMRYTEGNLSVREFLNNGNYLGYLDMEEILIIIRTVLEKEKEIIGLNVILKEKKKSIEIIGNEDIELYKHFLNIYSETVDFVDSITEEEKQEINDFIKKQEEIKNE